MYDRAEVNARHNPSVVIESGKAEITIPVLSQDCHSGGTLHGSIYFKMMDDSAFFAANSLEEEFFLVTSSFTTYLTKPVSEGEITAIAKVLNRTRSQTIVESVCFDSAQTEVARGNGVFVRSKVRLKDLSDYRQS